MRTGQRWSRVFATGLVLGAVWGGSPLAPGGEPTGARSRRQVQEDLKFAADMAASGLWREALFRWERVLRDRPDDPRILNNIAVAAEALGQWERASEVYAKAAAAGKDRQIAANYELFRRRRSGASPGPAAKPEP